jgi:hypothetical protein
LQVFKETGGLFVWAGIQERFKDGYHCADTVLHESNVFIAPGEFLELKETNT